MTPFSFLSEESVFAGGNLDDSRKLASLTLQMQKELLKYSGSHECSAASECMFCLWDCVADSVSVLTTQVIGWI